MLDFLLSTLTLTYFLLTAPSPSPSPQFHLALALNILHLLCHLLVLLPVLTRLITRTTPSGCLPATIYKQYVRASVISGYRMPVFCCVMLVLSVVGLYAIIASLFKWESFGFLFAVFCLIGSSLSTASQFIRLKLDCSYYFSTEVYKYFCLAVASIMFGISASQPILSPQILAISWIYFVYRSKHSLPKEIMYYLVIFLDIVFIVTAVSVIVSSQKLPSKKQNPRLYLIFSLIFYFLMFIAQIYQFIKLYRELGTTNQFGSGKHQSDNITRFYLMLEALHTQDTTGQREKSRNGVLETEDCSICLEKLGSGVGKWQQVLLKCGHYFHFQCLEEWAYINQTCPMCRTAMIETEQEIF